MSDNSGQALGAVWVTAGWEDTLWHSSGVTLFIREARTSSLLNTWARQWQPPPPVKALRKLWRGDLQGRDYYAACLKPVIMFKFSLLSFACWASLRSLSERTEGHVCQGRRHPPPQRSSPRVDPLFFSSSPCGLVSPSVKVPRCSERERKNFSLSILVAFISTTLMFWARWPRSPKKLWQEPIRPTFPA